MEVILAALLALYQALLARVEARIERASAQGSRTPEAVRRDLAAVLTDLHRVERQAVKLTRQLIERAYVTGADIASDAVGAQILNVEDARRIEELVKDVSSYLTQAHADLYANTRHALATAADIHPDSDHLRVQTQVRERLEKAALKGDSQEMRRVSVLCRDGKVRRYQLDKYAFSVALTASTRAIADATVEHLRRGGWRTVYVPAVKNSCQECKPHEGEIFSIDGEDSEYPPLSVSPPWHVNCRHRLVPGPR